jgi:hypothetical protein
MADMQIQDYTLQAPAMTDKILFQSLGGVTNYTTWAEMYQYGRIYEYSATGVPGFSSVLASYVPYVKRVSGRVTTPLAGVSNGITLDVAHATSARFTLSKAGVYRLSSSIAFAILGAANTLEWAWHLNGTTLEGSGCSDIKTCLAPISTVNQVTNVSPGGDVLLAAGDYLDMRVKSVGVTNDIALYALSLCVNRLSP